MCCPTMTPAASGSVAPLALPAPCRYPAHVVGREHARAARTNCTDSWESIVLLLRTTWVFGIMVIWYYGLRGTTVPGAGWVLQGCAGAKLHAVFGG